MRSAAHTRPEPAAAGTLEARPFAHLFVYAREAELTGSLELTDASGAPAALFVLQKGRVTKARADHAPVHFGAVAYELGLVTKGALDKSLTELAKGGKRHGDLLVAAGALTKTQVDIVLAEQIFRKVAQLSALPASTSYAFYDGYDALKGWPTDGPRVDPLPGVWRGVRAAVVERDLRAVLERLGTARWRLRNGSPVMSFAFDSVTVALLDGLRNPTRIPDFLGRAGSSREVAQRMVYVLALTNCFQQIDAQGVSHPSGPPVHNSGTFRRLISFEVRTPTAVAPSSPPNSGQPPLSARPAQPASARPASAWPFPASARPSASPRAPATRPPMRPSAPPSPSSLQQAADFYREAKAALESNQLKIAEQLCRRAHDLAPGVGRYAATLVWIDASRALDAPPEHVRADISKLDKILGDDPHCEDALFYRATLLKRLGLEESALRDFARVAALNPRNADAAREVEHAEARKKKKTPRL